MKFVYKFFKLCLGAMTTSNKVSKSSSSRSTSVIFIWIYTHKKMNSDAVDIAIYILSMP